MKRGIVTLMLVTVAAGGYFASQLFQPQRFADRSSCLYLSKDSLSLRNMCDEPLAARLCLGEREEPLRCQYLSLAPDEKSQPAVDLAAGKSAPPEVRYGACKKPYVPSTIRDPDNASLTRFGCRKEGNKQQELAPFSDFLPIE